MLNLVEDFSLFLHTTVVAKKIGNPSHTLWNQSLLPTFDQKVLYTIVAWNGNVDFCIS